MHRSRSEALASIIAGFVFAVMPLNVNAENPGEPDFAKGWNHLRQKQYAEARSAFEAGLNKSPSNALAHYYLAEACRGMKDWSCAEEQYEAALDLDPKLSAADTAKPRLRKAKAWRLIGEARKIVEGNERSRLSEAAEKLAIAEKLGLDDEQIEVHKLVKATISGQQAEDTGQLKAYASFKKMMGSKWKFTDGSATYFTVIKTIRDPPSTEFQMYVDTVDPVKNAEMIRGGLDKTAIALFGFTLIDRNAAYNDLSLTNPNASSSFLLGYGPSVIHHFLADAEIFARGYLRTTILFDYDKETRCSKTVSTKPVRSILAYVPKLDTIRLLPLEDLHRGSNCMVYAGELERTTIDMDEEAISEMVRVR